MYADMTRNIRIRIGLTAGVFFILLLISMNIYSVKAAQGSISVKEINYLESTITLQVNSGDTEVYYSDSKKKTWERVPGAINSSNTITMDISWISVTTNYVLTFKADKSTNIISVTLPKQAGNFKASYNKVKNKVSFSNGGTRTIEWRKKGSLSWNTVNTATLTNELSALNNNGATIYFRLAPINGTSNTYVGFRASKEVSITIPKKAAAPNITVDGSKFGISVKKGMAYRFVNNDGTSSDWININGTSILQLKDIAASVLYTNPATIQSEITLQFRTNATSSAQVSKVATVTIPIQEGAPDITTSGINLSYTSSSSVSLHIKAASTTAPYEYTIIKKDQELNYQTANWTTISSSSEVILSNKTAPTGCHIYVRKKSIPKSETVDFALASAELDITGVTGIEYPQAPTVTTLSTLITTAGVCRADVNGSFLTFSLFSPTSTTVSTIEFLNTYGISKGTVTSKSTVVKNSNSTGLNDRYIITTKITSTETIDTITQEKLYAKITLANSDKIISSDTSGVILYMYPNTKLNNPTKINDPNDEYTGNFNRIYMSKDTKDDKVFKFKLDFGTRYVPEAYKIESFTSEAVGIKSIKYDGYTLNQGTDYSVEYGSYLNDDDKTIATATVTVNVSNFETSKLIDVTDVEEALRITLNNGETLNNSIYIKLINTATIDNAPIAWAITEGSLKETIKKTVTNSDNTTTTTEEEVISYIIDLTLFDKSYGVGIADVTWGGISILDSTMVLNGKASIYLSNVKINKLTTDSTDTKNIVITLSNGFVIESGCKLTILNAS